MLRLMGMRGLAAFAVVLLLSACSRANNYVGAWTGPDGPAERGEGRDRRYEVRTIAGSDHCDWESIVFLQVGWPLGTAQGIGIPTSTRSYVRDADNKLAVRDKSRLPGELDTDGVLPAGATDSGYRVDDVSLWFGPDRGDRYAYLMRDGSVERWPRASEPIACA